MAINYYGAYQPFNNGQVVTPIQNQPQVTNQFAWVQGEAGANAFTVMPGNTVMLMDSENPILYMKSADQSGRPSPLEIRYLVSKEDYEKLQNGIKNTPDTTNFVTREELQNFIDEANSKFVIRREKRDGKSSV